MWPIWIVIVLTIQIQMALYCLYHLFFTQSTQSEQLHVETLTNFENHPLSEAKATIYV